MGSPDVVDDNITANLEPLEAGEGVDSASVDGKDNAKNTRDENKPILEGTGSDPIGDSKPAENPETDDGQRRAPYKIWKKKLASTLGRMTKMTRRRGVSEGVGTEAQARLGRLLDSLQMPLASWADYGQQL